MISIPVSIGELADKITILQIKAFRMPPGRQRENVHRELSDLARVWSADGPQMTETPRIAMLLIKLRHVNEKIWELENSIRRHMEDELFNKQFIGIACSIHRLNDKRASIKREINLITNSSLIEEKYHGS